MNRTSLLQALSDYSTPFPEEMKFIERFNSLLQHPRAYFRDHLPGHLTGSAWIVDPSRNFVLLTHHAKLHRWLQPGGHADGDEDIFRVGMKEAVEETGIEDFRMLTYGIFDIDIHRIPARSDFAEHDHYDVRILVEADTRLPLHVTDESHDLQWIPITELKIRTGNNASMLRMAEKVRLFAAQ